MYCNSNRDSLLSPFKSRFNFCFNTSYLYFWNNRSWIKQNLTHTALCYTDKELGITLLYNNQGEFLSKWSQLKSNLYFCPNVYFMNWYQIFNVAFLLALQQIWMLEELSAAFKCFQFSSVFRKTGGDIKWLSLHSDKSFACDSQKHVQCQCRFLSWIIITDSAKHIWSYWTGINFYQHPDGCEYQGERLTVAKKTKCREKALALLYMFLFKMALFQ